MEDYKAKFEKLIRRIDNLIANGLIDEKAGKAILKDFTVESEDDNIRKAILELVKQSNDILNPMNQKSMIDWLEKQGEKIDAIENFDTEFEKQVSCLIASTINKEHEYNEGFVKWTANALLNYAKRELEKDDDIEYIRTDAFIEKACEWLQNYTMKELCMKEEDSGLVHEFINNFKNYMKGE